jgi:hypothetical protein
MRLATLLLAALALVALSPPPASAQNARAFVSARGSDANDCSYAAPCRTFAGAHNKTNPGGEISVLDPGGYGKVTITKSISIVNDGVGEAGMLFVWSGVGITVNAGAIDIVSLRGLIIDGGGVGTNGIKFNTGKSLTVTNTIVRRFTQHGIYFLPNTASSLTVSNAMVTDNGSIGIFVSPTGSGAITAVFTRVEVNANAFSGIYLSGLTNTGSVKGTVSDSSASGNAFTAYVAQTDAAHAPTSMMLYRSVAANNGGGVYADGVGAIVRMSQSVLTANNVGWGGATGIVNSYGDNYIDGNNSFETAPTGIPRK